MPAIITNAFRKYNADNFKASFSDVSNKMYLMIGKASSWSGVDAGQYADANPSDTAVPTPKDTTVAPYIHHDDLVAIKLINASDVSHVIKRLDWDATGVTVYDEYDHEQDDLIDKNFFVMTDQFNVYKCISNNNGAASTQKPIGQDTTTGGYSDGYRWKFMYEVQQADVLKYVTTDWIPARTLSADDGTTQWSVQSTAVDGALEHIDVTAGGTGYTDVHSSTAQATGNDSTHIKLATTASAVDDAYNNSTVYISLGTGNGQLRTITDYDGTTKIATVTPAWTTNPDQTSQYDVMPAVTITSSDGTLATARVSTVTAGVIKTVTMINRGTGYRSASVVFAGGGGSNAAGSPRIGPKGGHGKDPVSELGGAYVMMNVRLTGTEGGDFAVGDDFRKVILIANPNQSNGTAASATTYQKSELQEDSGNQIYMEFRAPINRASDQTEDVKLVVEF